MNGACENCGRADSQKPAIFRGERWCSDLCRKALVEKPTFAPGSVILVEEGSGDDH